MKLIKAESWKRVAMCIKKNKRGCLNKCGKLNLDENYIKLSCEKIHAVYQVVSYNMSELHQHNRQFLNLILDSNADIALLNRDVRYMHKLFFCCLLANVLSMLILFISLKAI